VEQKCSCCLGIGPALHYSDLLVGCLVILCSISNLGMFSVDHFSAIINPPQACILAVGRGVKKVVWEEDADGGGRPKTVTQMLVTLSVDHRVYDGETGGRFLKALHANLSDPKRMLL
jgi:pyruvate dehydrogenase E2 component (dihydrolipoamide acetyltransferase)